MIPSQDRAYALDKFLRRKRRGETAAACACKDLRPGEHRAHLAV